MNVQLSKNYQHLFGFLAFCLLLALFSACGSGLQTAFNGTFIRTASSEFSIASDTLIISQVENLDFRIERNTGIRMLDESGKPGKLILETEVWPAVYDEGSGTLTERRKGQVLTLDQNVLKLEEATYRRIP